MLTIWIVTTVMVALASAVSWAVTVSMGESGVIDVWAHVCSFCRLCGPW